MPYFHKTFSPESVKIILLFYYIINFFPIGDTCNNGFIPITSGMFTVIRGLLAYILVPRSSVSFGHMVGETEALVSAVTGCPKIADIHSLIRVVHSFFISQ